MKKSVSTSVIIFALFMVVILTLQKKAPELVIGMAVLSTFLFLFSMIVRNSISFKPYFTSRYNVLTSKVRHQVEYDLPKDILFEKMKEVLTEAGFKVRHADKDAGILVATSAISLYSWGENIYVDITESSGKTKVDFCSACFFGIVSWGRNEKNYERMMETFENSLII